MKRIELFEFEDFAWFPRSIRSGMTKLLVVLQKMIGTAEVVGSLIDSIREKHDFDQIVDMGSGSGGIMPLVLKAANSGKEQPLGLLLTDLHPHPETVRRINEDPNSEIHYRETPFDATNMANAPVGLKTMMNSFHHLAPENARKVLKTARDHQEPLLIYEISDNSIPTMVWALMLPVSLVIMILMVLFMTPAVRPMTWQQIVFTYLIPVIPLAYAWDGQASAMRTYSIKDIETELLAGLQGKGYRFEVAHARNAKGKKQGYYVLGLPESKEA